MRGQRSCTAHVVVASAAVLLVTTALSDRGAAQGGLFARGDRVREVVETPAAGPTRQGMVLDRFTTEDLNLLWCNDDQA